MTIGTARGFLALAVFAYLAIFVAFPPLQLQDFPNHLARAKVMADLLFHHGAEFGRDYQFHFLFTPYVLGDLLLATLVQLAGVTTAATIWAAGTFLSVPCALLIYLRVRGTSAEPTVLMLLVSLYLSTDTFFMLGFLEFKLSIAMMLLALACAESLRKEWSTGRWVAFAILMVIAYLIHLATIIFVGAAIGASAVWRLIPLVRRPGSARRTALNHEVALLAPVICLLVWHLLSASLYRQPTDIVADSYGWGTLDSKLSRLSWDFIRYSRRQDLYVAIPFVTFLLCCVSGKRIRFRGDGSIGPQVLEPLALALVFLVLYFILPFEQAEASYIDVRALAVAPLFLLLGLLSLPARRPSSEPRLTTPVVLLAGVFTVANLGYLFVHFAREERWLSQYRAVVANIPAHALVLPVYTGQRTANIYDHLHIASFAVIDRNAATPYVFPGDRGSPVKYFRYVKRAYAPDQLWYQSHLDGDVDWKAVAGSYRYLLIMKPFNPDRVPIVTRTVAENGAAALVAIQ